MAQKIISIDGEPFAFLKNRGYSPISIFRGESSFLRTGPKGLIADEIDKHKRLLSSGFPLPEVLFEGETEGQSFYIEESFGDEHLGDLFSKDFSKDGVVSEEHFGNFLEVSERFAKAQLNTRTEAGDREGFYLGINMPFILEELPKMKQDLMQVFEMVRQRTLSLPDVWTHGDFNPHNLFPGGVIDIGNVHSAPAGYDLVSNIYHINNFPKTGDFEMVRGYGFSDDQVSRYFDQMDRVFTQITLPKLSDFVQDFVICRAIWSATRMQNTPKLQQWRYDKLTQMTKAYLSRELVTDIV